MKRRSTRNSSDDHIEFKSLPSSWNSRKRKQKEKEAKKAKETKEATDHKSSEAPKSDKKLSITDKGGADTNSSAVEWNSRPTRSAGVADDKTPTKVGNVSTAKDVNESAKKVSTTGKGADTSSPGVVRHSPQKRTRAAVAKIKCVSAANEVNQSAKKISSTSKDAKKNDEPSGIKKSQKNEATKVIIKTPNDANESAKKLSTTGKGDKTTGEPIQKSKDNEPNQAGDSTPSGAIESAKSLSIVAPKDLNNWKDKKPVTSLGVIYTPFHVRIRPQKADDFQLDDHEFVEHMKTLPPLEEVNKKKFVVLLPKGRCVPDSTLVLDLDGILIYSTLVPRGNEDFQVDVRFQSIDHKMHVKLRPGCEEFLRKISQHYEIILYSSSQKEYMERVLKVLDKKKRFFRHRLFRRSCVNVRGQYVRDLDILGRDLAKTVIIGTHPIIYSYHLVNGVIVSEFENKPSETDDSELEKLTTFLIHLAKEKKDMRYLIKKKFELHKRLGLPEPHVPNKDREKFCPRYRRRSVNLPPQKRRLTTA